MASLSVLRPGLDRDDFGAQQSHPGDVECLPRGVDGTHVDHALQPEQRARGRGGHSVLARTGLGDHPRLTHLACQQRLTQHVVDLVRTGVVEVFSFEEDPRATGVLAEPGRLVQRRRPAGVVRLQPVELVEVRLVGAHLLVGGGDFLDDRHQRLGDESPAVHTEMTTRVGVVDGGFGDGGTGTRKFRARDVRHHKRSTGKRRIGFNRR